ncbi:nucleotide-diphospho-sugar transferase [Flavobacteriaceae bacterium]|nr:nucleotide-diphospho-sugar transferase [Flavobacteriaceae bacterium]
MQYDIPILFIVYKRIDVSLKVFNEIKKIKPKQLFICSDGFKSNADMKMVLSLRKTLLNNINWDCDLKLLFREKNLGCGLNVSSSISWFFEHVEHGIILEDDCLPSESFFHFSKQMLTLYRDNDNVSHISGSNLNVNYHFKQDYLFSNYTLVWGWATWRKSWKNFNYNMDSFEDSYFKKLCRNKFSSYEEANFWFKTIKDIKMRNNNVWANRWLYSILINDKMSIIPKFNLIQNIGFDNEATNTKTHWKGSLAINSEYSHNIQHPVKIDLDLKLGEKIFLDFFYLSFANKILNKIKYVIKSLY